MPKDTPPGPIRTLLPGLAFVAMGSLICTLAWLDVSPSPRRGALFPDYGHWQAYGFGLLFALAGVLILSPPAWHGWRRAVGLALVTDILVTAAGTIWFASGNRRSQPEGDMTPFLNDIAAWLAGLGVHPVLGAFAAGILLGFLFRPRRTGAPMPAPAGLVSEVRMSGQIVSADGKSVQIPAQVLADARSGNKIAAIKGLRAAAPMDLVEAKRIVEMLGGRG